MKTAYLKSEITDLYTSISDFTTLGRDQECHMRFPEDDLLTDRHARIEFRDVGPVLKDLRSISGTFVNDTRIIEAILRDGDLIRVGKQEFVFSANNQAEEEPTLTSKNKEWNEALKNLNNAAKTEFPILLLGPSGTGKDIIAQSIHKTSYRRAGPFISVNCSALTETLIESELFGHVKGSFTGAISDRKGAFEAARSGTLFLDEIGDLSYSLQAKLLRALENNEIRPVGSDRSLKTDVRIIAATHQSLPAKIRHGSFRSDLYFRLNVLSVTPPALIDRMEDFDTLLYSFAKSLRVRFSFPAIEQLKKHPWPGNIRELKNLVSRAAAIFPKETIEESHIERLLDRNLLTGHEQSTHQMPVIKEIEKQMILKRLEANQGNQRRTAQDLGMPKSTLHDRIKHYNINIEAFKA